MWCFSVCDVCDVYGDFVVNIFSVEKPKNIFVCFFRVLANRLKRGFPLTTPNAQIRQMKKKKNGKIK